MSAASIAETGALLGQRGSSRGAGPILIVSVQHNGIHRLDQRHGVGSLHKGYALAVNRGQTVFPVVPVQRDLNLGEVFAVQMDCQADFLLLRGQLVGKFIRHQRFQIGPKVHSFKFIPLVEPGVPIALLIRRKGVTAALQRNVDLSDAGKIRPYQL